MAIFDGEWLVSIRRRIEGAADPEAAIAELRRAIEIKSAHLWRAEAGSCCFGPEMARCIDAELQILENTLQRLEAGDQPGSIALLEEYERLIGWGKHDGGSGRQP